MQLAIISFECPLCGSETLRIAAPPPCMQRELDPVQCTLCGHRVSDDEINIQIGAAINLKLSQYIVSRDCD